MRITYRKTENRMRHDIHLNQPCIDVKKTNPRWSGVVLLNNDAECGRGAIRNML